MIKKTQMKAIRKSSLPWITLIFFSSTLDQNYKLGYKWTLAVHFWVIYNCLIRSEVGQDDAQYTSATFTNVLIEMQWEIGSKFNFKLGTCLFRFYLCIESHCRRLFHHLSRRTTISDYVERSCCLLTSD